jgi:hypothetical protein
VLDDEDDVVIEEPGAKRAPASTPAPAVTGASSPALDTILKDWDDD